MKNILLLIFFLSSATFSQVNNNQVFDIGLIPKELSCSFNGTQVLYINGVSWSSKQVNSQIMFLIEPYISKRMIDINGDTSSRITILPKYNNARGFVKDFIESTSQKLSLSFGFPEEVSYLYSYFALKGTPLNPNFFNSIVSIASFDFTSAAESIYSAIDPLTYFKNMNEEYELLQKDTSDLEDMVSTELLNRRKVIIISESQGNLFVNTAIENLRQNGLHSGSLTGNIEDFEKFLGNLQIATPHFSNISKHKVVLNDEDIIRLVFFDRPAPTYQGFFDPEVDNRHWIDKYADHFVDGTYLNAYNSSIPIPALRQFTLQSLVDVASLLGSNCPKAVINYTANDLDVTFDSTDPDDSAIEGLLYRWTFHDGTFEETASKVLNRTYAAPGRYLVSLTVTTPDGADFGPDAYTERYIDIGRPEVIGCGNVRGRNHINPDGSIGGFVANTATVSSTSYIGSNVEICGNSQVLGASKIDVSCLLCNRSQVLDTTIIDSTMVFQTVISTKYSTVSNMHVTGNAWRIDLFQADITNSNLNMFDGRSILINWSSVTDFNYTGPDLGIYFSTVSGLTIVTDETDVSFVINEDQIQFRGRIGSYSDWPDLFFSE